LKIAQNAILRSKRREAPQFFSVWDQSSLVVNMLRHHAQGEIQKMKKIGVTDHAGAQYLETLSKARPDLAEKVHNPRRVENSSKKVWRPKKLKADVKTSADANMVFVIPAEFHAPGREEVPVAQLDLGP
jgi:hypothetical protein